MQFARGSTCVLAIAAFGFASAPGATKVIETRPAHADEPRTIVARFLERSYPAGTSAVLDIRAGVPRMRLELWRAGNERDRAISDSEMVGVPVGSAQTVHPGRVAVPLSATFGGVYYARLTAPGGWLGHAVVVVRPRKLGSNRIAVVLPTFTWAAYNHRDGATWYADPTVTVVRLDRPFLHRGVPYHFRGYDAGFLRWVTRAKISADYLTQEDLEAVGSGQRLAALYDLIVFSGHHEYVTEREYDLVEHFRDLGGNLMFLSANNFYYRVVRRGEALHGRWRWRDRGRPEAGLVGVQYVDWSRNRWPNQQYLATGVRVAPWLYRGTGLTAGDRFGTGYGIEIDARTPQSPRATAVVATIPDVFGPGRTAEMTYYETPAGAKVFAAGTINFGGSATASPVVARMLRNLMYHLRAP